MGWTLLWLTACAGGSGIEALPAAQAVLGWRLVPGQQLRYRLTTSWIAPDQERTRVEEWVYEVTQVNGRGDAWLQGHLTAFGVAMDAQGELVDESRYLLARQAERDRRSAEPVTLTLSMDGRLFDLSAGTWSDALPHRLLGLRLPEAGVSPGDNWPDPTLARPFADLWPASVDLEVDGRHGLEGLYRVDGAPMARVTSKGAAGPSAGDLPPIALSGESWWDLRLGKLHERNLRATWQTTDVQSPGDLHLSLESLD
jgi:hypothetical protein